MWLGSEDQIADTSSFRQLDPDHLPGAAGRDGGVIYLHRANQLSEVRRGARYPNRIADLDLACCDLYCGDLDAAELVRDLSDQYLVHAPLRRRMHL